jgi:periplasmic divalent cation tolerance protein
MTKAILVMVTVPSGEKAVELARTLVEERLAACANLLPARSIYFWEGKVCDDAEVLMLLKSRTEIFDALRKRAAALHPHRVPEILRIEINDGHAPYLEWILANIGSGAVK